MIGFVASGCTETGAIHWFLACDVCGNNAPMPDPASAEERHLAANQRAADLDHGPMRRRQLIDLCAAHSDRQCRRRPDSRESGNGVENTRSQLSGDVVNVHLVVEADRLRDRMNEVTQKDQIISVVTRCLVDARQVGLFRKVHDH